ncbi:N-acetylglucosamine kinase isoform X1 [Lasioglossum baleicum]|uniref:N-acetylglucosamine kinase isoform X1 n=2 Tax=Lasioglossum baleicum TaxID=434251 RepID=UPI003FCEA122
MAGKKGKKGKKKKKVDEYQLRRNLRDQARRRELEDMAEKWAEPEKDLSAYARAIRLGGIEGGCTRSTLIIMDGEGGPLTEVEGPQTNHWILGIEETAARINAMVQRGKENLGIPETVPLNALGLCLSGCEDESNLVLVETMREQYPNAAKDYFIGSDTIGGLRTASDNGGIVLIAGTGSNAIMINTDGTIAKCGGWGHMMGDEGSAYWLTHRACKYVFDDIDGLFPSPEPICYVWPAFRNFFKAPDRTDMLQHLYKDFDKSKFASFAVEIAKGCEKKDPLCLHLMKECGVLLAKHIVALANKADRAAKLAQGGLKVICVGSVWKSWEYIKNSFLDEIHDSDALDELSLYRLTVSGATGACYLAAEKINWAFPKPYQNNAEIFYHYKRENYAKPVEKIKSKPILVPCNTVKGD